MSLSPLKPFNPVHKPVQIPALSISEHQEAVLESHFARNKTIHPTDVQLLAAETGLIEEQVQRWFSNRVALWRKEQGLGPIGGRF